MTLAVLRGRHGAEERTRFEAAVRDALAGDVRMKGRGCRAGHYLVREDAVEAFERLASEHGLDVFVYAPEELDRPGRG